MTTESKSWLQGNMNIWERHIQGNNKYLDDIEVSALLSIAKDINPAVVFITTGCAECIKSLISFCFRELERDGKVRYATFPKQVPTETDTNI